MAEDVVRSISEERDWFVLQVVVHHRAGDHYPDPWVIGRELSLTQMETESVLRSLRAIGWIAASPYDPERLRLTPRCWDSLRRMTASSDTAERPEQFLSQRPVLEEALVAH
jgi:hypothetical protein